MRQILLVAGILGGGLPVLAQSVPAPPATPPPYQESIVVTASVEGEERSDLPASVTVIPAEEIAALQATQVIELLELIPGLHVVQAGGPGQLANVFTRGAESDQTLVLWNGVPLNDPYLGGFYDWAFLPVEGVERVEVVRGPFSSLYGSDALGGVVQLISARRDGGSVRLEGGEDGYGRAGFSLGRALREDLQVDLDGHVRQGDGELPNSGYDGEEAALRAEWQPRPGLTVGLLGRANDSERGVPFFDRQTPSPDQRYFWESREVAVPVRLLQGRWQLEGRLARTSTDAVNLDGAFARRAETSATVVRGRAAGTYELRPAADEESGAGSGWLALGADWDRQEAASADDFGRSLDGESRRNWAAFTQLNWKWRRLSLDLGLRHDDNEFYGSETSPRAGVVVALNGDSRLRASYGEAFRAPSLFDVFHPLFGNPEVRPETSRSLELGIERRTAAWGASLVAFETHQDDRIDFDPVTFQSINAGRARSRGLEGEVEVRRGIWSARLGATRLEAEDRDTGQPLLRRPETTASLLLRLAPAPAWSLYTVGRYVGERPDIDDVFPFGRVTAPDYLTFDLGGRWQARSWIAPYARVENLADEQYEDPFGYPHPGRTWVGGVAVTW